MSLTLAGATALAAGLTAAGQAAAIGGQAAANSRVARLQNEFNIDMWNRTNEYNSPQAQMQRLSEAGLNPNLIYGSVNTGNTSPAQQVAPQAPDFQRGFSEITKAFNVQNLMLLDANRKKAEADADNALTNARRNRYQLEAERHFGLEYDFDPSRGQFVRVPQDVINRRITEDLKHPGYLNTMVAQNYYRGSLLPYRAALLESQKNYLAPQIWMENYNKKFYPVSYWIGQGTKAIGGVSDLGGMFLKFPKFSTPKTFNRNTTFNSYYNY